MEAQVCGIVAAVCDSSSTTSSSSIKSSRRRVDRQVSLCRKYSTPLSIMICYHAPSLQTSQAQSVTYIIFILFSWCVLRLSTGLFPVSLAVCSHMAHPNLILDYNYNSLLFSPKVSSSCYLQTSRFQYTPTFPLCVGLWVLRWIMLNGGTLSPANSPNGSDDRLLILLVHPAASS